MRCIMKKLVFCLLALLPLLSACVNVVKMLDENNTKYHFRETRWGFSRERVELSEAGIDRSKKPKMNSSTGIGLMVSIVKSFIHSRITNSAPQDI